MGAFSRGESEPTSRRFFSDVEVNTAHYIGLYTTLENRLVLRNVLPGYTGPIFTILLQRTDLKSTLSPYFIFFVDIFNGFDVRALCLERPVEMTVTLYFLEGKAAVIVVTF